MQFSSFAHQARALPVGLNGVCKCHNFAEHTDNASVYNSIHTTRMTSATLQLQHAEVEAMKLLENLNVVQKTGSLP